MAAADPADAAANRLQDSLRLYVAAERVSTLLRPVIAELVAVDSPTRSVNLTSHYGNGEPLSFIVAGSVKSFTNGDTPVFVAKDSTQPFAGQTAPSIVVTAKNTNCGAPTSTRSPPCRSCCCYRI